jgi:hypothetical protein
MDRPAKGPSRWALVAALVLALSACNTRLPPREAPPAGASQPWVPSHPLPEPGDQSPLYPQN